MLAILSMDVEDVDATSHYEKPSEQWTTESALKSLVREFPDFKDRIRDKHILDFGCGDGFQTIAMARSGAARVVGVDIADQRLEHGRAAASEDDPVCFVTETDELFDLVISQNAFEHFNDPAVILQEMSKRLNKKGRAIVSFGPPWKAPYGGHMYFFTRLPWVTLLFSENTVLRIRSLYRNDGSTTYTGDLNQMTLKKFKDLIISSPFDAVEQRYSGIRGWHFLTRVPIIRELFTNHISVVLAKPV